MSVPMEHDDDDEPLSKVVESQNETGMGGLKFLIFFNMNYWEDRFWTETVLIEEGVKSEIIENGKSYF